MSGNPQQSQGMGNGIGNMSTLAAAMANQPRQSQPGVPYSGVPTPGVNNPSQGGMPGAGLLQGGGQPSPPNFNGGGPMGSGTPGLPSASQVLAQMGAGGMPQQSAAFNGPPGTATPTNTNAINPQLSGGFWNQMTQALAGPSYSPIKAAGGSSTGLLGPTLGNGYPGRTTIGNPYRGIGSMR